METATERRARHIAGLLALAVLVVCLVVVAGYALGVAPSTRLHPRLQGMSLLTACAIGALSLGIVAATRARARERLVAAAVVTTLALIATALSGHLVHDGDEAGPWFAKRLFDTAPDAADRMSAATALTLLLLAISLALRRRPRVPDLAAGTAFLIAAVALLGFLYGAGNLSVLGFFATMAVHTAILSMGLAVALLLVEPRLGWSKTVLASGLGGRVTRRQLALLVLPVALGWLLHRQQLSTGTALLLLVLLTVAPLALLVLRDGRSQVALDAQRRLHAEAEAALARELEQRLAQQADQLDRQAAERARIQEGMYRTQRIEAIGQLSGGIAHDFNNLLTAIGGNLELMLRKLAEGHPARRHATIAIAAVGKGARLASQMLAFSRSQRLMIRPTEIAPALLRARELIGTALGPSVDLSIEYARESAWAKTDPDQLELAIFNLAVNARDAMPSGGQVRIESGLRRAHLAAAATEATYVSIRVTDDGVGMTPEVLAKAIEPFFTTRGPQGSGLGLAQVYGFARQCEGDLVITSAPGEGTTVEILLLSTEGPHRDALDGETELQRLEGRADQRTRLLVVDDDDAVRGVLVELLGDAGYDVSEAADGLSALASLERIDPQVAVIDFMMPGMNGAEVARRAQARLPHLPIVFVSGYHDTMALDGIAGAVVLRKPFGDVQLQSAVARALEARVA